MRARTRTEVAPSTPMMRTFPALLTTFTPVRSSAGTLADSVRWLWASARAVCVAANSSRGTASTVPTIFHTSLLFMAATSTVQPPQHRQHAPVVVLGGRQVQLGEDVADVLLDRAVAHDELTRDGVV